MTTAPSEDRSSRNSGIDLLRGLSILFVILNHLGLRIPLKKTALADVLPGWFLSRLNYNGYEAVFVFFVISGFLIAGNALQRWGGLERIDLRAFYARRFARIMPCLLALWRCSPSCICWRCRITPSAGPGSRCPVRSGPPSGCT